MKYLHFLILINLLFKNSKPEPFITMVGIKVLVGLVKITALSITAFLNYKLITEILTVYKFKKKIAFMHFLLKKAKSGKQKISQILKDKKYKKMDKTLEEYKNFQKKNEETCRTFFLNKISDIFFAEQDFRKMKKVEELLKKEKIKSFKKTEGEIEDWYIVFNYSEIINIIKDKRKIGFYTMGYNFLDANFWKFANKGFKKTFFKQLKGGKINDNTLYILEHYKAIDKEFKSVKKLVKDTLVSSSGNFLNDLKNNVHKAKIKLLKKKKKNKNQNDNLQEKNLSKIDENTDSLNPEDKDLIENDLSEINEKTENLNLEDNNTQNDLFEKDLSNDEKAENLNSEDITEVNVTQENETQDNDINFLCEMIYVINIKIKLSTLCIEIHNFSSDEYENFTSYEKTEEKILNEGEKSFEICMDTEERENIEIKQNEINQTKYNLNYYLSNAKNIIMKKKIDDTFFKTENEFFYKSFLELYTRAKEFEVLENNIKDEWEFVEDNFNSDLLTIEDKLII